MGVPLDTLITTPRLILAPARRQDYADWARLRADSRAYIEPWEPLWPSDALSRRDWNRRLSAWNDAWKGGTAYVFFTRRQSDNALLGGLSFTQVRAWPANAASLGYWQGAGFEGQGYMRAPGAFSKARDLLRKGLPRRTWRLQEPAASTSFSVSSGRAQTARYPAHGTCKTRPGSRQLDLAP